MRVVLEREKCQGHGQCVLACPELFDADDQGFAVLKSEDVPPPLEQKVERASLRCPERAIRIER